MKKYLRGYKKQYFKLSIIAMYSTLYKLCRVEANYQYHLKAFEYQEQNNSPPLTLFIQ